MAELLLKACILIKNCLTEADFFYIIEKMFNYTSQMCVISHYQIIFDRRCPDYEDDISA